jgi:hypothetical protein
MYNATGMTELRNHEGRPSPGHAGSITTRRHADGQEPCENTASVETPPVPNKLIEAWNSRPWDPDCERRFAA